MTDLEWDAATDPAAMLQLAFGFETERILAHKLRRFVVAACRRVWQHLPYAPFRDAVEAIEALADGEIGPARLRTLADDADHFWQFEQERRYWWWRRRPDPSLTEFTPPQRLAGAGVCGIARAGGVGPDVIPYLEHLAAAADPALAGTEGAPDTVRHDPRFHAEREAQAELVREVFGNPYWRQPADRRRLTRTVVELGRLIDRERCYQRLPILADALLDAGCDDERVIGHCHSPTDHVRGCWVVDLLVGRS